MKHIIFWKYGSICEPYLEKCLKQHAQVQIVKTENRNMMHQGEKELEILRTAIRSYHPVFVFSINFFSQVSEVCLQEGVEYVGYTVDVPVNSLFCKEVHNTNNHIFMFDRMQYLLFSREKKDGRYYLPLAADVDGLQNAIRSTSMGKKRQVACDISFVGSLYDEKDEFVKFWPYLSEYTRGYLSGVIEAQLRLPTGLVAKECITDEIVQEFQNLCPDLGSGVSNEKYVVSHYLLGMHIAALERKDILSSIADKYPLDIYTNSNCESIPKLINHGMADSYKLMPVVFAMSKINLNITFRAIESGLPQRIWDVCGSGGFLLTNYQEELGEYFEIGNEVECYFSKEELLEKIAFYLRNDDVRTKIAQKGFEKVEKYHTYDIRLQQMLKMMEDSK